MSQLGFYAAKHLGIAYVGVLYFLISTVLSSLLFRLLNSIQKLKRVPTLFVITSIALVSILSYHSRLIVKNIPFFLNGMYGYNHSKLKEINGGVVIAFSIFSIQTGLVDQVRNVPWIDFLKGSSKVTKGTEDKK